MPDAIGNKTAHDYHLDVPAPEQGFFAKGLGHGDWGAKNRLSHLFNPKSGNTVMLAFDHGYIMGATAGLERMDVTIAPLCRYADVLMATRGAIRSQVVLELENRKEREIISGYDNVAVSADPDNPTVCQVEFSFSAAQGLNQIWLTAHITV